MSSRSCYSTSRAVIPRLIGVVHLLPLPGSPGYAGSFDEIISRSLNDCKAYLEGGIDGLIVENFGDVPFTGGSVPPIVIASMTRLTAEMKRHFPEVHFGVNVLRNDAESALSIAYAVGAEFIRVNVHIGAVVADQGIIQGKAYDTLRLRKNLGSGIRILADVSVKHSAQIGAYGIETQAADALERGLADAIVVSGSRTGEAVNMKELKLLRSSFPNARIVIGSGADGRNVKALLKYADSVIIGTSVKVGGVTSNPVDPKRLKDFVRAASSSK